MIPLFFKSLDLIEIENNRAPFLIARFLYFILFLMSSSSALTQSEIPLGTWRLHISYNNINSITRSDQKVFGASQNGIVVLDRSDNSISTYSKMNGLQGSGITCINYDGSGDQLLIAYADGKLDLIKNNTIISLDPTRNSTLTGSKKINHISIRDNLAYLSADYGVVIFDLDRGDVKETWRDIGENGQTIKVFQSTFREDSIFLATDKGVLAGDLTKNLLDFNYWKRFDTGEFADSIHGVQSFNGKVYAAIRNVGLYRYEAGNWTKENFLENEPFRSLNASSINLLISSGNKLWRLSTNNTLSEVAADLIDQPNMAFEELNGQLWIGDGENGIVSNPSGTFVNYLPNGPSNSRTARLLFNNKIMYALGGGYSSTYTSWGNTGRIDQFVDGSWSTRNSTMLDLTDIAFNSVGDRFYLSSFGYGVEERSEQESLEIFNENNSPLINTNSPVRSVNIPSVEQADDGLWVANYGASNPLHFLTDQHTWQSFSFPYAASRFPSELAVDFYSDVWMIINPAEGGGVVIFNKDENTSAYLTNIDGSGGLPSKSVRSIAVDRDGIVWLGTDEGVGYFVDPTEVFSNNVNAARPIFEDRFLLRDDKVTSIAIDGGNRKWMGTERGVWLFSPSGEKLIYNFTTDNSPLLSNVIVDIEVNHETGEVFFATDQGLTSFRADATASDFQFHAVKIFPNPVTPDFNGTVGISGLATDAIVKITDIAGKLIWESQANGGTASWNIRDYKGNRASTGVYLVFSTSADGIESVVGKVVVVE